MAKISSGASRKETPQLSVFEVLRLQHQIPAVHRRIFAENGFHLIHVVANARRRPQVGMAYLFSGSCGDQLQHFGVKVLPVGQLTLSSGWNTPAASWRSRKLADGTTVETGATRH